MTDRRRRVSELFPHFSPDRPAHGGRMKRFNYLVAILAGVVVLLNLTPSWGQPACAAPGCNATKSDVNQNTAGGTGALQSVLGQAVANTAFGFSALFSNATGVNNTATGAYALINNTIGFDNTASGASALATNTAGNHNTATGSAALANNFTGGNNTANGANALRDNIIGNNNTAAGYQALLRTTIGNSNTASGAF